MAGVNLKEENAQILTTMVGSVVQSCQDQPFHILSLKCISYSSYTFTTLLHQKKFILKKYEKMDKTDAFMVFKKTHVEPLLSDLKNVINIMT